MILSLLLFTVASYLSQLAAASNSTFSSKQILLHLPVCHHVAFDNCLKRDFFTFGRRHDVRVFATSSSGFDRICRSLNVSLSCIERHLRECSNTFHIELFNALIRPMVISFRRFMCAVNPTETTAVLTPPDDGATAKQNFLHNAECIRDNVFAVDKAIPCLNNYLLAFEYVEQRHRLTTARGWHDTEDESVQEVGENERPHLPPSKTPITDWLSSICCAHAAKRRCTDDLAKKACGAHSAALFDEFFENIHFGFFKFVCAPFQDLDPETEFCRKALPPLAARQAPLGIRSTSGVSRFLVSYFPFNYVTQTLRDQIQEQYRAALQKSGD